MAGSYINFVKPGFYRDLVLFFFQTNTGMKSKLILIPVYKAFNKMICEPSFLLRT